MLKRAEILRHLGEALRRTQVVALLGPRQCGKTTLARQLPLTVAENYLDLENPLCLQRLAEPKTVLAPLRGLVVIDEIQRRPELFPVLRVLADRHPLPARFLVLGSASPELLRQSSESLAGRIEYHELGGFALSETGAAKAALRWLRGGFPRSFLARSRADSRTWRRHFIRSVIERDLPQLGVELPSPALHRFWHMVAHAHGTIWNGADPARSLGVAQTTVRRYLDLLTGLFMVRQLPPWHANLKKRQVRLPKVYVRDTGLLHELLGIGTGSELLAHPRCGASWEGMVIEEVIAAVQPEEAYFWATHQGAELDLLLLKDGRRLGVEVKRADAPALTPSMKIACSDLELEQLVVLYPGNVTYALSEKVTVRPLTVLVTDGWQALFPRPGRGRR